MVEPPDEEGAEQLKVLQTREGGDGGEGGGGLGGEEGEEEVGDEGAGPQCVAVCGGSWSRWLISV